MKICPFNRLLFTFITIFFGGIFSIYAYPTLSFAEEARGKVISINNQDRHVYTNLGSAYLDLGEIVEVSSSDYVVTYLKVVGTSDAFSKLSALTYDEVFEISDGFDRVKIGNFVQPMPPSFATEATLNLFTKELKKMMMKQLDKETAKIRNQAVKDKPIEATLKVDTLADRYMKMSFGVHEVLSEDVYEDFELIKLKKEINASSSDLVGFKEENAILQTALNDLTLQVEQLRSEKMRYQRDAEQLRKKQSELRIELKQISQLVDQYVQIEQ